MANARRRTQRPGRTASRMAARTAGASSAVEVEEGRTGNVIDWQKEMHYINKDLRDLLVVTIILFILLFAAGFFL